MHDKEQRRERAKADPLALRLIEVGIGAGWNSHDCLQFAREAYEFLRSTVPEVAIRNAGDGSAKLVPRSKPSSRPVKGPEWSHDLEIRRRALQTLADRNLMMKEAAEVLGISVATVASTAHRLRIRFHGRRGSRKSHPAQGTIRNSFPTSAPTNGLGIPKLLATVDAGVKRRCPGCNQIFRPTELHHVLCDGCENRQYAAPPMNGSESTTPRHSSR
jgi:hypothetical protein